ncbi:MAG: hypothetical protein IT230_14100 [Flavobacteriales bacterium]|nr:hypothetical protein [Flavobacteriales bacterium]
MNSSTIGTFLITALITAACGTADAPHGHEHNHGQEHDHAAMPAHDHEHEHAQAAEGPAVQLDHGKTWAANPETTAGIAAMKALVEGYQAEAGDGAALRDGLNAEFKQIFAKCTMTGEAHDQLHNYLIPVKGMLDSLGTAPEAAKLEALGQYLGTYGQYFH